MQACGSPRGNPVTTAQRCLVLGGRGFIGSHLIDGLLAAGVHVRCFDRFAPVAGSAKHEALEDFVGDFTDEAQLVEAMSGCEICYHLVSSTVPQSSNENPVLDVESNLVGTLKLLRLATQVGVRRIVFASSGGTVYGVPSAVPIPESHPTNPTCSYGITKLAIEKYLALFHQLHGLEYSVLRLANPYGERQRTQASQGAVAVFLGKVLRGEPVDIWGDGTTIRDYIHIADVVDALLLARSGPSKILVNIGSGRGLSLNEVLDAIGKVTEKRVERRYFPARSFDVPASVLCIESARQALGWQPRIDFETGLTRFVDWVSRTPGAF